MGSVVDKVGVADAVSFSEFIAEYAKKNQFRGSNSKTYDMIVTQIDFCTS